MDPKPMYKEGLSLVALGDEWRENSVCLPTMPRAIRGGKGVDAHPEGRSLLDLLSGAGWPS